METRIVLDCAFSATALTMMGARRAWLLLSVCSCCEIPRHVAFWIFGRGRGTVLPHPLGASILKTCITLTGCLKPHVKLVFGELVSSFFVRGSAARSCVLMRGLPQPTAAASGCQCFQSAIFHQTVMILYTNLGVIDPPSNRSFSTDLCSRSAVRV